MKKNYSAEWDAGLAAPMQASVPVALGGLRLDQALARLFPQYSRNRLQAWLRSGHIRVDGASRDARQIVAGGEHIVVEPPLIPDAAAPKAQRMALKVVYEDADIIVIDKPAGLVVHPGAGQPDRTLVNALLAHAPSLAGVPRAGVVHRLDKDTSGLLVVAKTVSAQASLAKQLAERTVRRIYLALVQGDPPASGVIDAPLGRDVRARTRMAVNHRGKPARTSFRVLERFGRAALVECKLETGRTHQIRVHFQHIRHPLVGDPVYRRGTRHGLAFARQALHAAELSLIHPSSGERMSWQSTPPKDFRQLLESLRREK
ncbi:MAG TPA: RluA family pseudouridine synthase [Burkholderiales bacterium]|jgi:23S rRNA pseudouridine1911/1915/1917 synthase|nr:RluA family pseudouridine synthase [Burkholderiales bacterium]